MVPVVALYSTFLQRAFDQMMQDVALLHLHVVFAIDRAGLVGDDGPTHHGVFDVGFLRQMPGFCVLAPASLKEQQEMLCWAIRDCNGPVAVRYPRGTEGAYTASSWDGKQKAVRHRAGRDVTLITYGTMINSVLEAAERLEADGHFCRCGAAAAINGFVGRGAAAPAVRQPSRWWWWRRRRPTPV